MSRYALFAVAAKEFASLRASSRFWWAHLLGPGIFIGFVFAFLFRFSAAIETGMRLVPKKLSLALNRFADELPPFFREYAKTEAYIRELASESNVSEMFFSFAMKHLMNGLVLIPLTVGSFLAIRAFAKEKERKTIESLLFAPVPSQTIFFGKLLASSAFSLSACFFALVALWAGANVFSLHFFHHFSFPDAVWSAHILWLSPNYALFLMSFNLWLSAKSPTVRAAQNAAFAFEAPLSLFSAAKTSALSALGPAYLILFGFLFLAANLLFLSFAFKRTSRDKLFESQIS